MTVRTRFAPSPTGQMHVGGVRTALFAYLIAKQANGQFILRIEDTDKAREVEGSTEQIIESLNWLGTKFDEGPGVEGDYGPYKQSERLEIYKKYAQDLIDKGLAYADPYTQEELQQFREEAKENKIPFLYRHYRPENPPQWDGSQPLRFKIPQVKRINWHDEVRGNLTAGEDALDDFIIIKADGYPTYNFAHIVDDHEMKITHVIRGEEFISSTPKFLALYEGLGFELPKFVTVPPILGKNGGKKLSKRDGAKSVLEYRDDGYMPEVIMNFLATLGWNDGTEQEIFSPQELLEKFSIDRIQASGANFDDERLIWISGHHIRNMNIDDLYEKSKHFFPDSSNDFDDDYKKHILSLNQERLKFFTEIPELSWFFFEEPKPNVEELTKKVPKEEVIRFLMATSEALSEIEFNEENIESTLRGLVGELDVGAGKLFKTIRVAVTGTTVAPGLFATISALGKDRSLKRLAESVEAVGKS